MPRKRKSRSPAKRKPRRSPSIRALVTLLLVLALAGVAGVKFLQTPRGGVFLVDHGVGSAYPRVQREVSAALKRALAAHGLRRHIRARPEDVAAQRATYAPLVWDVTCDDAVDLLLVNVSLTEAVEEIGARVRDSEQFDGGRTLVFRVGTGTKDTHRLTLRRMAPGVAHAVTPEEDHAPKLAIVIDDFGYSKGGIPREVLDLDMPLTISILPGLAHSRDVLRMAKEKHRCILLHLPMESARAEAYDETPISASMSDEEIAELVGSYLESLPGVDGVNNHMGSLATTDARVMRAVCGALENRDVLFLDSLTSSKSVAYNTAVAAGLRAASNTMFIDDATERREDVAAHLHELVEVARARGQAIGIGHPHPWTFEALRDNLDFLETSGVELVTVCDLTGKAPRAGTR